VEGTVEGECRRERRERERRRDLGVDAHAGLGALGQPLDGELDEHPRRLSVHEARAFQSEVVVTA
jgi:hypothetical protein